MLAISYVYSNNPAQYQMGRVVNIEQLSHATPLASLTVVHPQQGNGQTGEQLYNGVYTIDEKEINSRIDDSPDHHPCHLRLETSPVGTHEENGHGGNAAPIGGKGDQTDKGYGKILLPLFDAVVIKKPQHHQPPGQRPDHAGLVKDRSPEGDYGDSETEIIGKVGKKRQQEQTTGILFHILGVMVSLRNEEPHDGSGQPADDMGQKHEPPGSIAGEQRPGQMVDGHGSDGNTLDLVGGKSLFHGSITS